MRKRQPKMRKAQSSDGMERGPYYYSDFNESEFDSKLESKSERVFAVDEELNDYDADEYTSSQHFKVPFDAFLYDFYSFHVYNERENVDDKVTREKGHSNNEMEDEEDEVDQRSNPI